MRAVSTSMLNSTEIINDEQNKKKKKIVSNEKFERKEELKDIYKRRDKLFQRGRISIDGSKIKRLDSNSNPSRLTVPEPVVKLKVAVNSTESLNTYSSTTTSTISPTHTESTFAQNSTFQPSEKSTTVVSSSSSPTNNVSLEPRRIIETNSNSSSFELIIPRPVFCNQSESQVQGDVLKFGCEKPVIYAFFGFNALLFLLSFILNSICIKGTWERWKGENRNARKNLMISQPKIKHMALWKTVIAISSILFCASHIIGELATLGGILADDGVLSLKLDRVENLASVVSPLTETFATVIIVMESLAWFVNHWHSVLLILVSLTFLGEIDKLMNKKKNTCFSKVSAKIGTSFLYAGLMSCLILVVPIVLLVLVGLRTNGDFVRINQVTLSPVIVGDAFSEKFTFWTMLVFFILCPGILSIILSLAALQKVKCHIRCQEEEAENYSWNIPKKSLQNFRKYLLEVILRATFNFLVVVAWFFSVDWDPETHYFNPVRGLCSHLAWKIVVCFHSVPIFLKIPDFVGSIYHKKKAQDTSPKQAVQKTISVDTQKTNFSSISCSTPPS